MAIPLDYMVGNLIITNKNGKLLTKGKECVNIVTSKQRAYLRGLASTMSPIYRIGKSSISPDMTKGIDEALEARELIKISVLNNCADDPREIAETLAARTRSQVVQVVGHKITLYRESKNTKKIQLPK